MDGSAQFALLSGFPYSEVLSAPLYSLKPSDACAAARYRNSTGGVRFSVLKPPKPVPLKDVSLARSIVKSYCFAGFEVVPEVVGPESDPQNVVRHLPTAALIHYSGLYLSPTCSGILVNNLMYIKVAKNCMFTDDTILSGVGKNPASE
jgi:hypothetical protein